MSAKSRRRQGRARNGALGGTPSGQTPASAGKAAGPPSASRKSGVALAIGAIVLAGAVTTAWWRHHRKSDSTVTQARQLMPPKPAPANTLTFNRDIAPIIFSKCSGCHRPGQAAPFPLLTYDDIRKHAKTIAQVTHRGYMPPWLPEPGHGDFAHDRRLDPAQLAHLQQWLAEGLAEGNPADLPPAPTFPEGWQLGQPDLVVTLPEPYSLAAEGKDVYRNLVVPVPVPTNRYVKGVEFLPGNARVVHHAFVNVDETRKSRRLAERQTPAGFDGMDLPDTAMMPGGHFLGWQPGKAPYFSSPGLSWTLRTNTDLVLQLHLHPSGRPETVQPSVGFFFTDQPPTNTPFRIALKALELDIPPGATDYAIEQSYVTPVDLNILRVSTHAHYLAKEMQGYAILPGGEKKWLIHIKDWDFNWQGDYEYLQPQFLPKGSRVVMHYTYDNSTNNVQNPSSPPRRVRFGLQTTDEMGELWLQALPRTSADREVLANDYFRYLVQTTLSFDRFRIGLDSNNVPSHVRLGRTLHLMGRLPEAMDHLSTAVRIDPKNDQAHYELGLLYLTLKRTTEAQREFEIVTRLNPNDHEAYGNLGGIHYNNGRLAAAQVCFEAALRINPDDTVARDFLDRLSRANR